MFLNCGPFLSLDFTNFNTEKVINMEYMLSSFSINELDLSNFNTKNVINMSHMFDYNRSLKSLNLSNFNNNQLKSMKCMFFHC